MAAAAILLGLTLLGLAAVGASVLTEELGSERIASILNQLGFLLTGGALTVAAIPYWPWLLLPGAALLGVAIILDLAAQRRAADVVYGYAFVVLGTFLVGMLSQRSSPDGAD